MRVFTRFSEWSLPLKLLTVVAMALIGLAKPKPLHAEEALCNNFCWYYCDSQAEAGCQANGQSGCHLNACFAQGLPCNAYGLFHVYCSD